jgi:transposase
MTPRPTGTPPPTQGAVPNDKNSGTDTATGSAEADTTNTESVEADIANTESVEADPESAEPGTGSADADKAQTDTASVVPRPREALGRSRGGLSTKIHLAADQRCRPIIRLTSPGQHGDSPYFPRLLDTVRIRRRGPGRPRTRPGPVLADKAYSDRANRAYLRRRGIKATIPEKKDQQAHRRARGRAGGRPPAFHPERYKQRNTVERAINKLKGFRAVATRYDKRERIYQGTIDVASIMVWLRDPVP